MRDKLHLLIKFLSLALTILSNFAEASSNFWLPAHATFYGTDQNPTSLGGACGYDNTYYAGFGVATAAVSAVLFQDGSSCGSCYQLTCDGNANPRWCHSAALVTVTVTNFCPPNYNGGWCDPPHPHFDLSVPAFSAIAYPGSEGVVPVLGYNI